MLIVDAVYDQIHSELASFRPERGGALYGLRGYPCITHFEYDEDARTTQASYLPSSRLIGNVRRVEAETGLEFKGIIHSHPDGFARPSIQDERAAATFFRLNPHHAQMAMPIVQSVKARQNAQEEFLYWFRVERTKASRPATRALSSSSSSAQRVAEDDGVIVLREEYHILPLYRHFKYLVRTLEEAVGQQFNISKNHQPLQMSGATLIGLVATDARGDELMYFISMAYPVAAPLILYRKNSETASLNCPWDGTTETEPLISEIARRLAVIWKFEQNTSQLS